MNRQTQTKNIFIGLFSNNFIRLFNIVLLAGVFAFGAALSIHADDLKSDKINPEEIKTEEVKSTIRVGVFNRTRLLKVFYSSEIWAKRMQKIFDEYLAAEKRDDRKKMVEMKARTKALEDFSKKQLKSGAHLNNIFEYIWTQFPDIAKEAGVDLIVEKPLYRSKNIEVVDITKFLCDKFPLAEKNKKK